MKRFLLTISVLILLAVSSCDLFDDPNSGLKVTNNSTASGASFQNFGLEAFDISVQTQNAGGSSEYYEIKLKLKNVGQKVIQNPEIEFNTTFLSGKVSDDTLPSLFIASDSLDQAGEVFQAYFSVHRNSSNGVQIGDSIKKIVTLAPKFGPT